MHLLSPTYISIMLVRSVVARKDSVRFRDVGC